MPFSHRLLDGLKHESPVFICFTGPALPQGGLPDKLPASRGVHCINGDEDCAVPSNWLRKVEQEGLIEDDNRSLSLWPGFLMLLFVAIAEDVYLCIHIWSRETAKGEMRRDTAPGILQTALCI